MGDADLTRNLRRDHPAFKEIGCPHPTPLHRVVIT
jgi:hypothetical protein